MASTDKTTTTKRVNPVFKKLRDDVRKMSDKLRAEYDADGELRAALMKGNQGVRCFMKCHDILSIQSADQYDEAIAKLVKEFKTETKTVLHVSTDSAVNMSDTFDSDTMVVLYAPNTAREGERPQADPLGMIYGGLPSELTELALRSDLLWHLKAPALFLSNSNEMCELHTSTSFFLPSIELRKASFENDFEAVTEVPAQKFSLMLTSDVSYVADTLTYEQRESINVSNLIRTKVMMPFYMALRQNVNRKKLGLPLIRELVIGDMNLPKWERLHNTYFAQRVKEALQVFDGCFDTVTVCGPLSTVFHLQTLMSCAEDA